MWEPRAGRRRNNAIAAIPAISALFKSIDRDSSGVKLAINEPAER
jgi:hypothetical protein